MTDESCSMLWWQQYEWIHRFAANYLSSNGIKLVSVGFVFDHQLFNSEIHNTHALKSFRLHINSVNEAENPFVVLQKRKGTEDSNGMRRTTGNTKKNFKKVKRMMLNNNGELLNCNRNESNIQLLYYRMMYIALVHNTTRTKTHTVRHIEQIRNMNAKCKTSWRLIIINKSD